MAQGYAKRSLVMVFGRLGRGGPPIKIQLFFIGFGNNFFFETLCRLMVNQSICPSVCPSVCVFTFEVPLKRLFAPASQNRMSNILEIQNPWGKSSGKKWSHI